MSDKLASTVQANITFSSGETPTPTKLNAVFSSLKNAISKLEKVIGDVHDESYPYFSTDDTLTQATSSSLGIALGEGDKQLNIANLARLIGPSASLNPLHLSYSTQQITESITSGVYCFKTKYPIQSGTVTFSGADTTAFTSLVASTTLLIDGGDYYIDNDQGEIFCIQATASGTSILYTPSATFSGYASYDGASFNVIPDPSQTTKCTASGPVNGQYTITLPSIERQEYDDSGLTTILSSSHINYDLQLQLPKVLDHLVTGDQIPSGFIYLIDNTTNAIYKDAAYYYSSESELLVSNVTLDTSHEFTIVTIGTNITQSIQDLNLKLWRLRRGQDGYSALNVQHITNRTGPNGSDEPYVPSDVANNHFPQYLHRDGWFSTDDDGNINDQNGLRGDLVVLSSKRTANSRNNLGSDSHKIYFGKHTDGPYMYYKYSATVPRLQIVAQSGYGTELVGSAYATDGFSMGGIGDPWPQLKCVYEEISAARAAGISGSWTAGVSSALSGKTIISYSVATLDATNKLVAQGGGSSTYEYYSRINSSTYELAYTNPGGWPATMTIRFLIWYTD